MTAQDRGWGSPIPYGDSRVVAMTMAGTGFPAGVHRRVKPVLESVAAEFHQKVEPLADPGCWGHAYRKIRGSNAWSNHAWGLAIDINAPAHPMGTDTMSAADERECRRIARHHGCRWGGDYSGRIDQQHFEFMGTPAEADRIAANLGGGNYTEGEDMIGSGDQGQAVTQWQQALKRYFWFQDVAALPEHGPDGDFGGETVDWTRRFQKEVGLPRGMVTPADWQVMGLALHRADDPLAAPVEDDKPAKLDNRTVLDFARLNREAIGDLSKKVNALRPEVDEEKLAGELAPKLNVNRDIIKAALREVLRQGVNEENQ